MQGPRGRRTAVLVVEADAGERGRLGDELERAGFDVLLCPGPMPPDYTCVGSRQGACPLVASADVVVLDLWLESDTVLAGTPAEELLELYVAAGRPVVALGAGKRMVDIYGEEPVVVLERRPPAEAMVRAVQHLLASAASSEPAAG